MNTYWEWGERERSQNHTSHTQSQKAHKKHCLRSGRNEERERERERERKRISERARAEVKIFSFSLLSLSPSLNSPFLFFFVCFHACKHMWIKKPDYFNLGWLGCCATLYVWCICMFLFFCVYFFAYEFYGKRWGYLCERKRKRKKKRKGELEREKKWKICCIATHSNCNYLNLGGIFTLLAKIRILKWFKFEPQKNIK